VNKTKGKAHKNEIRTLHIPKELHRKITIAAAHRDQDIRTVVVEALTIGLPKLELTPQTSSN